jgi:hypothetical protein
MLDMTKENKEIQYVVSFLTKRTYFLGSFFPEFKLNIKKMFVEKIKEFDINIYQYK